MLSHGQRLHCTGCQSGPTKIQLLSIEAIACQGACPKEPGFWICKCGRGRKQKRGVVTSSLLQYLHPGSKTIVPAVSIHLFLLTRITARNNVLFPVGVDGSETADFAVFTSMIRGSGGIWPVEARSAESTSLDLALFRFPGVRAPFVKLHPPGEPGARLPVDDPCDVPSRTCAMLLLLSAKLLPISELPGRPPMGILPEASERTSTAPLFHVIERTRVVSDELMHSSDSIDPQVVPPCLTPVLGRRQRS